MVHGRNWKDFKDAWRVSDLAARLGGWLRRAAIVLTWPLRHPHRTAKEIEPWGILFAVVGLFLSLLAFFFDYRDRVEERTVRAWQLVTTRAPGNSGKVEALEYLNSRDGFLCNGVECAIILKESTPLTGIDLSTEVEQAGVYLRGVNLTDAYLFKANLERADLTDANLQGANLFTANLSGAYLRGTNLTDADLSGADLTHAYLTGANLREATLTHANLTGADITHADLSRSGLLNANLTGANLQGVFVSQRDLYQACGDGTLLVEGLTIQPCSDDWRRAGAGPPIVR